MKRLAFFLGGIALGALLAVLIGWVLLPLQQQQVSPDSMRHDYQMEYVRLVAVAYRAEGDLVVAERRLRELDGTPFTAPLVDLAETWIDAGRSSDLVTPLADLARAFGVDTPAMAPYLQDVSP
ncbi:MAG: hypothetical protein J7M39_12750 [Anaerolineae bacterium]|nr:hypothetical protein [Anaerolineae bacterium]